MKDFRARSIRSGLALAVAGLIALAGEAQVITTVAGGGNGDGGAATSASLAVPTALVLEPSGAMLIAESLGNRIRRISSGGVIVTIAGTGGTGYGGDNGPASVAALNSPEGLARDAAGNLYIADSANHRIRKISSVAITTIAGTGTPGFGGDGGAAGGAQLDTPTAVAVDASGNLFIADSLNNRIRKVTPGGTITTVAGNGSAGFGGDGGPAASALLDQPSGLAIDASGNLFFADSSNHRIRKVTPGGVITTVAGGGFGGDNAPAVGARLLFPLGVAVDSGGILYIADTFGHRVRKVSVSGTITTVAGNGSPGFSGDSGPATSASLYGPTSLALDPSGNLFIADAYNNRIRKVSPSGIITTVAGCTACNSGDGFAATSAALSGPSASAVDTAGNLLIVDSFSNQVRKVSTAGVISTLAGTGTAGYSGDDGPAVSASLNSPGGIAVDGSGNVFVADTANSRIRRISSTGTITTVAGNGAFGFGGDNGAATSATFNGPTGVAVDGAGNLFVADSSNNRIRKISPGGTVTSIAGTGTFGFGGDNGPASGAGLAYPMGMAVDGSGNVYFADYGNNRVRRVSAAGSITTIAGGGAVGSLGDNGPATNAYLASPRGVAIDAAANLYVADAYDNRVRKVSAGVITTVAGTGVAGYGGDNGAASAAILDGPSGVALDSRGDLYIADLLNRRIRKVALTAPPNPPRLSNISTRGQVLTGDDVMIAGLVVGGPSSKTVVINVAGPSLAAAGISNPLSNPQITLVRSADNAIVASNDDWQNQSAANVSAIQQSGFAPGNLLEPAIIATLAPGNYTAVVSGVGGATGVGLVGVFEVDHPEVPLLNISTRGKVLTGSDVMIAGFIVQGSGPKNVVVSVAGPSLANFGISSPLGNPTLTLVRSSDNAVIAANDDWQNQDPTRVAAIQNAGVQPNHALEPALIATLAPGAYTAIVSGIGGVTGTALVGVFALQ